ncbi:MAG: TIM barrel protein, partial [Gammaproteobacteria bacterium]
ESHRGYLGTGNVDFDKFFGALKQIDYRGPITFESFSSEVVDPNLSNTLCVWRNLWKDSDDLAKKALSFIKERY